MIDTILNVLIIILLASTVYSIYILVRCFTKKNATGKKVVAVEQHATENDGINDLMDKLLIRDEMREPGLYLYSILLNMHIDYDRMNDNDFRKKWIGILDLYMGNSAIELKEPIIFDDLDSMVRLLKKDYVVIKENNQEYYGMAI